MKVEILRNVYTYNSFLPIRWGVNYDYPNIKKTFNFFYLFFVFKTFSYVLFKYFIKSKKKFVVLRSPFHFKTSKHLLMYKYYTVKMIFYTIYKYIHICNYILTNYFFIKQIQRSNVHTPQSLNLTSLINF